MASDKQDKCSGASCCCEPLPAVNRRELLKIGGATFLVTTLGGSKMIMAGPFDCDPKSGKLIPADKKLDPKWVKSLYERGKKEFYKGKQLDTIGMPCCGIGSGQLYLCGDGTIGDWQVFGNAVSYWIGTTNSTFTVQKPKKPIKQGFAVAVKDGGKTTVKKLNKCGVEDVEFQGEYPVGIVRYKDKYLPVDVTLEAFSPYIPLDAKESSFPATILEYTVENKSRKTVEAGLMGWLENGICLNSRFENDINGKTSFVKNSGTVFMTHSVDLENSGKGKEIREPQVFEDFEGEDWGKWTVEGESFGDRPTKVSHLEGQGEVGGIDGKGYANSMNGGDKSKGKLTSPKFVINRRFVNFLLGGGGHQTASIHLIVDGEKVRQSTAWNNDTMSWRSWFVEEFEGKEAIIVIEDSEERVWGRVNVDQIEFSDETKNEISSVAGKEDMGEISLICLDGGEDLNGVYPDSDKSVYLDGDSAYQLLGSGIGLERSKTVKLKPGEKYTYKFILSWYFPNMYAEGRMYAERFKGSVDVGNYIISNYEKLRGDTYLWRDALYGSTLPYWLIDRLHSTISILSTGTTRWWKNGRFYAFEGCTCCHGTCTHVWGYAQGHARLFPELARNIRERQDLMPIDQGGGFYPETGLVAFRGDKDFGFAADGQCGTVLNAYREHLMSADKSFLKRNWEEIKKALEYLILQDAKGEMGGMASPKDAAKASEVKEVGEATEDPDGIITGQQHNTYDINYHGANTLIGSLYLAALRAGEEMAKEVGDDEFAKYARKIYEKGSKWTVDNLWNGEYFIQKVDLEKYPKNQYVDGCLADQIFGQMWAHQVGLGYIYPEENVKSTIHSIWKYNWAPDVAPYNEKYKPFRWFISPGQAGLFTCTWPKSEYMPEGTMYKNEIWTGIEYQVAANLINEDYVTEGLAICRAIHDRYQPGFLNPYNEIECGDHYARAMASWGVYLALAGFKYNGPNGILGFAPKMTPKDFRAVFTFAEGWGSLSQKRSWGKQVEKLEIHKGKVKLNELRFEVDRKKKAKKAEVRIGGDKIDSKFEFDGNEVIVKLNETIELKKGQTMEVKISV